MRKQPWGSKACALGCGRPKVRGELCASCLREEINMYVSVQEIRRLAREESPAERENEDDES